MNRYLFRNQLAELIDRYTDRHFRQTQAALGQVVQMSPRTPDEMRLDHHLDALADEYALRGDHLDAYTVPTVANVRNRNVDRNNPW